MTVPLPASLTDPLTEGDDDGNTPLEAEEREQLRLTYITTRADLNAAEQAGIIAADRWAFSRKRQILDTGFLRRLHKRMYGNVWRWAGNYRTTARNIGIDAYTISTAMEQMIGDANYQISHETYSLDEIALRFHHRLTHIHPFPNGNGRHARLAADLFAKQLGQPRFSWGRGNLQTAGATRKAYIAALRAADNHDINPLLAFVRS